MFDSDVYFSDICKKQYYLPEGGLDDLVSSPNYLGEIILWIGVAIISYSSLEINQLFTLISPIFTYLLLVHVSGINLLEKSGEKKWGNLNEYKKYKRETPRLFWFM